MLQDPADSFLVRYLLDESLRDRADRDLRGTLAAEGVPSDSAAQILEGGEALLRRIGAALRRTADPNRDPLAPGSRPETPASTEPEESPPYVLDSACSIYIRISPRVLDGRIRYLATLTAERPDPSLEPDGIPPEAGAGPVDDLILHLQAIPTGSTWSVATRSLESPLPLRETRLHRTEGPEVELAARAVLEADPDDRYDAIATLIRKMTQ